MSISIIRPGVLDTLQSAGHYGFSDQDLHAGGAMDRYAAQVANMLAGNEVTEAVIEMHYPGPQILFEQNALISITGGDFSPMLNDEPLPLWQPVVVRKSTILHFPIHRQGSVAYLAVHGGFAAVTCAGDHCNGMDVLARQWEGRKLEKNHELQFGESDLYVGGMISHKNDMQPLPWKASIRNIYCHPHEIFMIPGDQYHLLTDQSKQELEKKNFTLHSSSGRPGFHLRGAALQLREAQAPYSGGTDAGAVHLLPDGHLLVMMADHPLTDNDPRIGHIASAHLPKLAQMCPGESFRLHMVDAQRAEELLDAQQQELNILRQACYDHLHELIYP